MRIFHSTFILLVFLLTSTAHAKDENCWVDLFHDSQYRGEHIRLTGPIHLENLRDVQGENWDLRVDSLKVGSNAKVIVFDNTHFKLSSNEMAKNPDFLRSWGITEKDIREDSELIFGPNSMVHDLNDFYFRNKIRSLKLDCLK